MLDLTDVFARAAAAPHEVTPKALADAGGVDERTGHRMAGGAVPKLLAFRRMVSLASRLPRAVKLDMLTWLVAGSGFAVAEADAPTDRELDANGDGRVTAHDAVIHIGRAVCASADAAREMAESLADGVVTAEEAAAVDRVMADAERRLLLARAALDRKRPAAVRMAL